MGYAHLDFSRFYESLYMSTVTIYHNPKCGTSRATLELIRQRGIEPTIVEYLKTPLSREALTQLIVKMSVPVRTILRNTETFYDDLKLGDAHHSDDSLIDAVAQHPILMNRPIVVTENAAVLCRPADKVLDILPKK